MKAMGIVVGSIATSPRTGDFDQAATVAIENKLKKSCTADRFARMFAQRRTVKERTRAEVLTSSTGKK